MRHLQNIQIFLTPSPLCAFGTDLFYEIHATSLTTSAYPSSPDADIIYGGPYQNFSDTRIIMEVLMFLAFAAMMCTVTTINNRRINENCPKYLVFPFCPISPERRGRIGHYLLTDCFLCVSDAHPSFFPPMPHFLPQICRSATLTWSLIWVLGTSLN